MPESAREKLEQKKRAFEALPEGQRTHVNRLFADLIKGVLAHEEETGLRLVGLEDFPTELLEKYIQTHKAALVLLQAN